MLPEILFFEECEHSKINLRVTYLHFDCVVMTFIRNLNKLFVCLIIIEKITI